MDFVEKFIRTLALLACYFNGLTLTTEDYIRWSEDEIRINEGDDIDLSCTAGHMTMFDVIRLTRNFDVTDDDVMDRTSDDYVIVREDHHGDENGGDDDDDDFEESYTLVDNTDVKFPITRISRYSFHFEKNSTFGTIFMRIRGVQPKDSGYIGCFKLKNNRVVVRTRIVVLERTKERRFVTVSKRSGDVTILPRNATEQLDLNTDVHEGFGCLISGYTDFIDQSSISLTVDGMRRSDFAYKKNLKKVPLSDRDIPHVQYRSIFLILPSDLLSEDGKEFDCFDHVSQTSLKTTINVQYPPMLKSCSKEKITNNNNNHDDDDDDMDHHHHHHRYSLACIVSSQSAFTVKVTRDNGYSEVKHKLTEQAISPKEVKINVTINEPMDTNQVLILHLANSFGVTTKSFDLSSTERYIEETIMMRDNKAVGAGKHEDEYQVVAKTANILGSEPSSSSSPPPHVTQKQLWLIIPVLVIAAFQRKY